MGEVIHFPQRSNNGSEVSVLWSDLVDIEITMDNLRERRDAIRMKLGLKAIEGASDE